MSSQKIKSFFGRKTPQEEEEGHEEQQQTPLDVATSQHVLWTIVVILLVVGGGIMGYGIHPTEAPSWQGEPAFYNLLWQAVLQILASYCSLIPVLRARHEKSTKNKKLIPVNEVVFYGSACLSIFSAILAPIAYSLFPRSRDGHQTSSTILNFAATIFAIIPATQLAGGVGELVRENKASKKRSGAVA
ncbi:hypothetical protein HJFPF1_13167 [Paramyrothecium foliicola]|nr:hypothetical protein HJFPF1_13167 [Paramyrothecium foliicola]